MRFPDVLGVGLGQLAALSAGDACPVSSRLASPLLRRRRRRRREISTPNTGLSQWTFEASSSVRHLDDKGSIRQGCVKMGITDIALLAVTRPGELRSIISYKVWRDPLNDIKANPTESGWDRENMRDCWTFLDLTSRSFAAVIKELKGELSRVICIFYLALRALDTIEDDMTIPHQKKVPLLVDFYKKLDQPGWNFTESGPDEKDRQLLVEFHKVIQEFQILSPGYRTVIADITAKMGAGMASYIEASSKTPLSVATFEDWDLYCHFVAGLVGEGLSRLFAESGIERPWLGEQLELSNHMGLFLQKVNIIRDYAEDSEQERFFWPQECWAAQGFTSQPEVAKGIVEKSPGAKHYKPEGVDGQRAMAVLSSMLLDAMRHSTRALDYLTMLREQSVFNFCAIPQVMAIATIELMVNNPDVLRRNVKIRKSQAVQLILRAVNPRDVAYLFLEYARRIHAKIPASDANYVQWQIELSRINVWCEHYYPSFVGGSAEPSAAVDIRKAALERYAAERHSLAIDEARKRDIDIFGLAKKQVAPGQKTIDPRRATMTEQQIQAADKADRDDMIKFFVIIMVAISFVMGLGALAAWYIAWYWTTPEQTDPLTLLIRSSWASAKGFGSEVGRDPVGWTQNKVQLLRSRFDL